MASPAEEEGRNWLQLPRDVTASILSRLTVEETLTSAQFVCKAWLEVSKDPLVWNRISSLNLVVSDLDMEKMCRHAVDRSCGQTVDVNLEYFVNDDLLHYITDRSSRIKRLRLKNCYQVSDEGLIKAVEKLPALEDLELKFCSFEAETLEAVGRKCPRLGAFKLKTIVNMLEEDDADEDAFAIGKSMPGLKTLHLSGNSLTNKGLGAILDGCPELESLVLRYCDDLRLKGKVWERCVKSVKRLRLHRDLIYDDDDLDYCFVNNVIVTYTL